jgi:hypothetical protein
MHQIAEERGGKCLSATYVDSTKDLEWECKEGHQWPATPSNIKAGKWCKACSYKKQRI